MHWYADAEIKRHKTETNENKRLNAGEINSYERNLDIVFTDERRLVVSVGTFSILFLVLRQMGQKQIVAWLFDLSAFVQGTSKTVVMIHKNEKNVGENPPAT